MVMVKLEAPGISTGVKSQAAVAASTHDRHSTGNSRQQEAKSEGFEGLRGREALIAMFSFTDVKGFILAVGCIWPRPAHASWA